MFNISERLKGAKSSETLGEILAEEIAVHEDATARQAALEDRKETVFLEGSADDIAALQDQIAAVGREVEPLNVRIAGLRQRVADAEAREAAARFETAREAVQRVAEAGVAIHKDYEKLAEKIADDLRALLLIEEYIHKFNRYARSVGYGDRLMRQVNTIVAGEDFNQSVAASVALPQADPRAQRFWPQSRPIGTKAEIQQIADRVLKKKGITLPPLPEATPAAPAAGVACLAVAS